MGLSSADIANATANEATRSARDLAVQARWMADRIEAIEAALGITPPDCPELPSEREQRLHREALTARRQDLWGRRG